MSADKSTPLNFYVSIALGLSLALNVYLYLKQRENKPVPVNAGAIKGGRPPGKSLDRREHDSGLAKQNEGLSRLGEAPAPAAVQAVNYIDALYTPERVQAINAQKHLAIDRKYAALFRELHLTSDVQQKLEELLVNKELLPIDLAKAMQESGGMDRKIFAELLPQQSAKLDESIKRLLGDKYEELAHYQDTYLERQSLAALAERFTYSSEPLSSVQQRKLTDALAQSGEKRSVGPYMQVLWTADFVKIAQTILTARQYEEFVKYAKLQQLAENPVIPPRGNVQTPDGR